MRRFSYLLYYNINGIKKNFTNKSILLSRFLTTSNLNLFFITDCILDLKQMDFKK